MKSTLPPYLQSALWSYDITKLDPVQDKQRIITNVLNHGTKQAVDWLFATYTKQEIADVVAQPKSGEWNKKSLNFWSIVFSVTPQIHHRFS